MRSFEHSVSEKQIGSKAISQVSARIRTCNDSEYSAHSLGKSSTE